MTARAALALTLLFSSSSAARAETIYASIGSESGIQLIQFESDTPGVIDSYVQLRSAPGRGEYDSLFLDFDSSSGILWGTGVFGCQILCPDHGPQAQVVRVDPVSGLLTPIPGDPWVHSSESDLNPTDRTLRFLWWTQTNYRISVETGDWIPDSPLSEPGAYAALAHAPRGADALDVETFAIRMEQSDSFPGEYRLVRVGGPGGIPSASSGQVQSIGPLAISGIVSAFDISESSVAYVATTEFVETRERTGESSLGGEQISRLYTIDLATGNVLSEAEIGDGLYVMGIAVAPRALGNPMAIPTLSPFSLVLLIALLAVAGTAALRRRIS